MSATRTWKCPQCGFSLEIGYDWLAEHGGPVCEHCDCDMDLQPADTDNERLAAELLEIGCLPSSRLPQAKTEKKGHRQ